MGVSLGPLFSLSQTFIVLTSYSRRKYQLKKKADCLCWKDEQGNKQCISINGNRDLNNSECILSMY